jgi:hypothetical protein
MERIRISNDATYSPLPLLDVALVAPLASRLLLGATLPGRVLQTAAIGLYAGSAIQDWLARQGVRRIEFREAFGADVFHLVPMPEAVREEEVRTLVERVNDGWTPDRTPRRELAVEIDRHLTDYIASVTGQRVETSTEVRSFTIAKLIFPFALGSCDMISGDVAIFRDVGVFEPHVIAHEFAHRKGYYKELEAQALAYLALTSSGEPQLVQSALCERLHRDLRVLAGESPEAFHRRVEEAGLRSELLAQFRALRPITGPVARRIEATMKTLYDERMKLTGQNGISDYDLGFTNFMYSVETDAARRYRVPEAGVVHAPPAAAGTGPEAGWAEGVGTPTL